MIPSGFKNEIRAELTRILDFWMTNMVDKDFGGYHGEMDGQHRIVPKRSKGAVLNARILWSFSAACRFTKETVYRQHAARAYDYFIHHFIDRVSGGVYWSLDHTGASLDRRKQVYAIAFAIYALAEYYNVSGDRTAMEEAVALFQAVERYAGDKMYGGYLEAFSERWEKLDDVRLSTKDQNEVKSMNTNLHVLEAYTNLYRVWPDKTLLAALKALIRVYLEKIFDPSSGHQHLFFDEAWTVRSSKYSYGHDIEASWLLHEAAVITGDQSLLSAVIPVSLRMAEAAKEGLDCDYGLMNEVDLLNHSLDSDKHWWQQAEAMVGFMNAFQITHDRHYLDMMVNIWGFIRDTMVDKEHGEWFWRVDRSGTVADREVKAGFWKCPYHNTRACIELLQRLEKENL